MFFNKINFTKDDDIYVGIDAHKQSYSVAIWLNDAPAIYFVMPADNIKLLKTARNKGVVQNRIFFKR